MLACSAVIRRSLLKSHGFSTLHCYPLTMTTDIDFRFIGPGALRKHSIVEIEQAIADALTKLTGQSLSASVSKVNFEALGDASFQLTIQSRTPDGK